MPCTTTASKKSKGRKFQQAVRDKIRTIGKLYGLENDDCLSTGMGQSGVDIILTPAARKLFDWYVEAKAVEALNVSGTFYGHFKKYAAKTGLKLLFHTRNRVVPLVTLQMDDFFNLYAENLSLREQLGTIQKKTTAV